MSYILDDSKQIKNNIINGNFDFWQRVAGGTTTIATASSSLYTVDRIKSSSGGPTTKGYSIVRSSDVPTLAQSGIVSNYSMLVTNNTAIPTLAAADYFEPISYFVEGVDYAKLHSKTVTLSFWFKASIVGTYSILLTNGLNTRNYVTTFSQNVSATWEFKSLTIILDNAGSWNFDNTQGLGIYIASATGSTYQTPTLNLWQAPQVVSASTSVNWAATAGATLQIAQLSLTEGGSIGPKGFARAGAAIQQELSLCQRYCQVLLGVPITTGTYVGGTSGSGTLYFPVTMRAAPSILNQSISDRNNNSVSTYNTGLTQNGSLFVVLNQNTPQNTYGSLNFTGVLDAEL